MKKQQDLSKRVEEALDSLEGIQRAEPAPYFFTRLKARLEREEKNVFEKIGRILARPAVAFTGLCLILALNVFILFRGDAGTSSTIVQGNGTVKPVIPEEDYIIAVAGTYDYENLEP